MPQNKFGEVKYLRLYLHQQNIFHMTEVKEIDSRDAIMEYMAKPEVDRDLVWLEKQTGISYSHLYYIFVRKERNLTDENREKCNTVLKTDFK